MALLFATDVGGPAWQRMAHDGTVVVLHPGVGHSPLTTRSPALRAASLAAAVPRRAVLTGACALWVHGWRSGFAAPPRINIAVPRGCHPDAPPGFFAPWWNFVTDQKTCATASSIAGVLVTDVNSALRSLLCSGDLADAVAASWWALAEDKTDAASCRASIHESARGVSRARALACWDAVCAAAGAS